MQITFLSAKEKLTKTYHANGTVTPYPHAYHFTSHTYEINNIQELHTLIVKHAAQGHCLLQGQIKFELNNQSRAGSTDPDTGTRLLAIDLDRTSTTDLDTFIHTNLPPEFHDASYVWQWSASAGITKPNLCGHLFFIATQPIHPRLLKNYYKYLNFYTPENRSNIKLTKTGHALSYGIDPTLAQNDKLNFIAPPVLHNVPDPRPTRITLVTKKNPTVTLDYEPVERSDINATIQAHIDALRKAGGFPKRAPSYKTADGERYLANPERAIFRGPYIDARGFRYGNLNSGDSYAYYHTLDNPKFLHNFKGEPVVRIEDIDPQYWRNWIKSQRKPGKRYTAFRDTLSDTYYTLEHDLASDDFVALPVSNLDKAQSFLSIHKQPVPDDLPLWTVTFDPTRATPIDYAKQTLNTYIPSSYTKNATASVECPPKVAHLLLHVAGNCPAATRDLINWLAHIVQNRTKAQTAFILHGRTGTGKGALLNCLLRPIIGERYVKTILMDALDGAFNEWLKDAILVMVDEAKMNDAKKVGKNRLNTVKHYITEPSIELRMKHKTAVDTKSYANFLFASNERDSVIITSDDRRFKVPPRQEKPINYTKADIDELSDPKTIQAFANYLFGISVNDRLLRTTDMTPAKQALVDASKEAPDEFLDTVETGDFDRIAEHQDAPETRNNEVYRGRYLELIAHWSTKIGIPCLVTANDLRSVFNFIFAQDIGPQRFAKMLANRNLKTQFTRLPDNEGFARCITVTWRHSAELPPPAELGRAGENIFLSGSERLN